MKVYDSSTISGGIVSRDAGSDMVSKDGFLKILTAQLQNQDPLNAQDNTQYVSQMAQFSALEQMQNLNLTMEKFILNQKFQEGSLMIGKIAVISLGDDEYTKEEVTGVKLDNGEVKIIAGDKEYSLDDIVGLESNPDDKGSGESVV